jgi:CRP-like cAMP-binding protein
VGSVVQSNSAVLYSSLWEALLARGMSTSYKPGALLFQDGSPAEGVYLLEKGEVRLTLHSEVKAQTPFGTAGPGSVLGLSEAMSGDVHKLRAVILQPSQVSLVPRPDLLEFLSEHHEFCMHIVRMLSEDLHGLYHRFQNISPTRSAAKKRALILHKEKSRP